MVDFTKGLVPIDTSPLMQFFETKKRDQQMALQNERQSKLDQLAQAQFQEAVKNNALQNARADKNAEAGLINAQQNQARTDSALQTQKLERERLELQIKNAESVYAQDQVSRVIPVIGSQMETALASVEAGQPIPEEVERTLSETFKIAEEALSGTEMSPIMSGIRESLTRAFETDSIEDYTRASTAMESILKFAGAGEEEVMSEYDRVRLETAQVGLESARLDLETDRQEVVETQENKQAAGDKIFTLASALLEDEDVLEDSSGMFSKKFGFFWDKSDDEWQANFDLLLKELTLEKLKAFTGAKSDAERIYSELATGLNLNLTDAQMKSRLRAIVSQFGEMGFKDTGSYRPRGAPQTNDVFSQLSPETQAILNGS